MKIILSLSIVTRKRKKKRKKTRKERKKEKEDKIMANNQKESMPYEVKMGDNFYFKGCEKFYKVIAIISEDLVVVSTPDENSKIHFIEYNPNPNSRGSTWTCVKIDKKGNFYQPHDMIIWYYAGNDPNFINPHYHHFRNADNADDPDYISDDNDDDDYSDDEIFS